MNGNIESMIRQIGAMAQDVEDGNESPFEALANLKNLESNLKEALKFIMDFAVHEGSKYEKTFIQGDHQFTYMNGRRTYNFKGIKEWADKKAELKLIEDKYKQAWMQKENGLMSVNTDGEVLELPEVTYSKDVLSVKLFANLISK